MNELYYWAIEEGKQRQMKQFIRLFNKIVRRRYTCLLLMANKVQDFDKYIEVKNKRGITFWRSVNSFYT